MYYEYRPVFGQDNSFTWNKMKTGLEMQFPILDSLRNAGKIRIETLEQSGLWFKQHFVTTPATAVTALADYRNEENKSVWYNSRYYRANLYWEKGTFRFRDIHLFDENFESDYLRKPGTGGQFFYFTLPVVDGFFWSTKTERAGLRVMKVGINGERQELVLGSPTVSESTNDVLQVTCPDQHGNIFMITFHEDKIDVSCKPKEEDFKWMLELKVPHERLDQLPFFSFNSLGIEARFKNYIYTISVENARLNKGNNADFVFQIIPIKQQLILNTRN